MNVVVTADAVHRQFATMAVGVEVNSTVPMAMGVKVYPIPPKTKQHVSAETDQQQSDAELKPACEGIHEPDFQIEDGASHDEQRQRMPNAPDDAMLWGYS